MPVCIREAEGVELGMHMRRMRLSRSAITPLMGEAFDVPLNL